MNGQLLESELLGEAGATGATLVHLESRLEQCRAEIEFQARCEQWQAAFVVGMAQRQFAPELAHNARWNAETDFQALEAERARIWALAGKAAPDLWRVWGDG